MSFQSGPSTGTHGEMQKKADKSPRMLGLGTSKPPSARKKGQEWCAALWCCASNGYGDCARTVQRNKAHFPPFHPLKAPFRSPQTLRFRPANPWFAPPKPMVCAPEMPGLRLPRPRFAPPTHGFSPSHFLFRPLRTMLFLMNNIYKTNLQFSCFPRPRKCHGSENHHPSFAHKADLAYICKALTMNLGQCPMPTGANIIHEIYQSLIMLAKDGDIPVRLRRAKVVGTVQEDPFDHWVEKVLRK